MQQEEQVSVEEFKRKKRWFASIFGVRAGGYLLLNNLQKVYPWLVRL